MRKILILLPLLGLAACATPRDSCIAQVSRDLSTVNALISQTEATLARGYGIETRQEVTTRPTFCREVLPDGTVKTEICEETTVRTFDVPVAIDLDAERTKLRQLQEQRDRLEPATQAAIQQCLATYPE